MGRPLVHREFSRRISIMRIGVTFIIATTCAVSSLPTSPIVTEQNEDAQFWESSGQSDLQHMLASQLNTNVAKNVILFVGDGMGVQTGTMARIFKGQRNGKSGEETKLAWEKFPSTGFSKTYNTDYQVADSAGTATAILSGVKTRMGMLGLDGRAAYNVCDPEHVEKYKVKNILHRAIEEGKHTGVVTTTRLTHATPGAAFAHTQNRDWEDHTLTPDERCVDIAKQLIVGELGKKINVLLGGGARHFRTSANGGKRTDEDLVEKWKQLKDRDTKRPTYKFLQNRDDLMRWKHTDYVLGLFSSSHLPYNLDRDASKDPSLSELTRAAIERLKMAPKGFVLLVEGGRIDHAHHETNAQRALDETLAFEEAIEAAMELTDESETLLVVTADHSHSVTFNGYPQRGNPILGYVSESHFLHNALNNTDFSPYSVISYANGPGFLDHHSPVNDGLYLWKDVSKMDFNDPDYRQPAAFPTDSETHGGEDVGIFAKGPMSHLFVGVHEQSYIAHAAQYAACLGTNRDHCRRKTSGGTQLVPVTGLALAVMIIQLFGR